MNKNFKKGFLVIIFGVVISCVNFKNNLFTGSGDINQARKNVIIDFANTYSTPKRYLRERNGRPFDVFWVFKKESKNNIAIFSVSPETDGHIPLSIKDSLGKVPVSYFPNNFKVKKGKLFVWKDSITPLRKNILSVMENFNVLDSTDIKRELGTLPEDFEDTRVVRIDHKLKSAHYFVCKKNIKHYKKVITNKAIGYYDPPKLNCK